MKPILISMPPDEERTDGLVALLGCGTRATTEGAAAGRGFNPPEKPEAGGEGVRSRGGGSPRQGLRHRDLGGHNVQQRVGEEEQGLARGAVA